MATAEQLQRIMAAAAATMARSEVNKGVAPGSVRTWGWPRTKAPLPGRNEGRSTDRDAWASLAVFSGLSAHASDGPYIPTRKVRSKVKMGVLGMKV